MDQPGLFFVYFRLFKQTLLQFLQQINVKNVQPVSGARIQNHSLLVTPLTLDQGSRPI